MREVEGRERVPQELQTSRAIVERGRICGPRVEREPDVLATSFLEGGIRIDSEIPDDLGMLGAMPVRETSPWSRKREECSTAYMALIERNASSLFRVALRQWPLLLTCRCFRVWRFSARVC